MFDTTFEDVIKIIESWKPKRGHKREAHYRDDLLEYLRTELNKTSPYDFGPRKKRVVQKETGPAVVDIAVEGKIGIELKYNLNTAQGVRDLFGQIETYSRTYRDIIVCFCGKINEDKINDFELKLKSLKPRSTLMYEQRIKIFKK